MTRSAFVVWSVAVAATAASFPPRLHFQSLETPRVTVHFHQGFEAMAREAAAMSTEIIERHEARYHVHVSRVQIVMADVDDDPNGFATPLPYPLVHLQLAAPDGTEGLGNLESWLRLVLTHELAHIVHLDEAHGILGFGRKVLGRAPFLFPNTLTPTWMIEGLATYEETEGTAFGRGRSPDFRMVRRMATLESDFPAEDRPVSALDRWPGGAAPYFFGEAFLRDLTERFGSETLPELARVHSGRLIPWLDDRTSKNVTGASFHQRWKEWVIEQRAVFEKEADGIRARGLTPSRPLTSRGVRQTGPRFSPDGDWVAYTSRTTTRFPAIRLVRRDGAGDRWLADRNGGASLSWTPDGRTIVYDEPDVLGLFSTRSDLRTVDVATGRVRRLTRGRRARYPDVAPDGRIVVFAGRTDGGSELFVIGLDGTSLRPLTHSEPATQWSGPRWSPQGDRIVAARWTPGGWLDLVIVDPESGATRNLTHDRATDAEPAWTPDGTHVVFRSDRDGISNLYAVRLADGTLLRLSNVLGGAFLPDVSRDGRTVAFANYSARGYDLHVMDARFDDLPSAEPFVDPYAEARPAPTPVTVEVKPYRPLPLMRPRFWTPYVDRLSDEWQYGAATGGLDPLFRHAWGLDVHGGATTGRISAQGFYQYDRFRPAFLFVGQDTSELGQADTGTVTLRTQKATLEALLPVRRTLRSEQDVALAWRRERQTLLPATDSSPLDLGGLQVTWLLRTTKRYPYSISPVDGYQLAVSYLKEDPAFGSDVSLGKLSADARAYARLGEGSAVALRLGGGATFGRPTFQKSYAVGGFPDASLFDVVRTNRAVLRGYADNAFSGRSYAAANVEYRFPLAHPQHGYRSLPFFVRHLHGAVFFDAGDAWSGSFHLADVKTAVGAAVGSDLSLGQVVPLTVTAGVARGFAATGETRFYLRLGLAF